MCFIPAVSNSSQKLHLYKQILRSEYILCIAHIPSRFMISFDYGLHFIRPRQIKYYNKVNISHLNHTRVGRIKKLYYGTTWTCICTGHFVEEICT